MKLNIKQVKTSNILFIFSVIILAFAILLVIRFPDPGMRMFLLKHPARAFFVKMNPTSFDLMALLVSQRDSTAGALVEHLKEHFGDNDGLMEYLSWFEGNLARGERASMEGLSEIKALLNEGGKLYEYSYEKGTEWEWGVIVLKGGKELSRMPIVRSWGELTEPMGK